MADDPPRPADRGRASQENSAAGEEGAREAERAGEAVPAAGAAAAERCGPLAVERFVKGDGRALLLFERVEPEQR